MSEKAQGIYVLTVVAVSFILLVWLFLLAIKPIKKRLADIALPEDKGAHFYENTRVLKKGIRHKSLGEEPAVDIVEYGIIFLLKTKEKKFLSVPQEVFQRLEEGMTGALVVREGQFSDFLEDIFQKNKEGETSNENVRR